MVERAFLFNDRNFLFEFDLKIKRNDLERLEGGSARLGSSRCIVNQEFFFYENLYETFCLPCLLE